MWSVWEWACIWRGGVGDWVWRWVAACDRDPARRAEAAVHLSSAAVFEDWRVLLEYDLDGVVLANDFDEHAPLAVAFLDRGIHVLSESAACADERQAIALLEAERRSAATYSFAENYVFHPHVRLLRKAVEAREIGRVTLVEADYLHAMSPDDVSSLIGDPNHWRGRIEPTAYCTHTCQRSSLSPASCRPAAVTLPDSTLVEPKAEGTVRILEGFRACAERGALPLVPAGPAVAASLVGVVGARSLRSGSCPVPMPNLSV